jgi:hypothetical protein
MRNTCLGLLAISASLAGAQPATFERPNAGVWSARAGYLWPGSTVIANAPNGGRIIRLSAPDSRFVLVVGDSDLTVLSLESGRTVGMPIAVESLAEVLWATDSQAFAVTQSDGGWVGSWSVAVYRVTPTQLQRVDVTMQAAIDFNRRTASKRSAGCSIEEGNFGALAWRDGSRSLALIAEAPPHSSDCDLGRLHGYLVDAHTGALRARYSAPDVSRLFQKELGTRFAGSNSPGQATH